MSRVDLGPYVQGSAAHERRYARSKHGPSPAEQLRLALAERRREGVPFTDAWPASLARIEWRCVPYEQQAWNTVLGAEQIVEAFAAAYEQRPLPRSVVVAGQLHDCLLVERDLAVGPVRLMV